MHDANAHKRGYQHTPLGWVPEEWEVVSLLDHLTIANGQVDPKELNHQNKILIAPNHIEPKTGQLLYTETSKEQNATSGKYHVKKGDIIYSKIRPYLKKVFIAPFECLCSADMYPLTPDNKIDVVFALGILLGERFSQFVIRQSSRTGIPKVNREELGSFMFPLPPLPEQRQIATILSTWDTAIAKIQEIIRQLQERNRGLMQELLTGKRRLKMGNRKWQLVYMGSLFERVQRKNDSEEMIDVLTISGKHGFLSQNDKFNRVIAGNSLSKYTLLQRGEFSYNKGNSNKYQYGCVFRLDTFNKALVPNVYISFKSKAEIDTTFYAFYFKHDLLKPALAKIISSGARMDGLLNVNPEDFFRIKIPLPPIEEQIKVGLILTQADQELQMFENHLAALQTQKKGLMQLLLTGTIRVNLNPQTS